jgi:hypothetical protein
MTHLDYFVFAPAVVALIVMAALLHEYRRPRARTPVEKRTSWSACVVGSPTGASTT